MGEKAPFDNKNRFLVNHFSPIQPGIWHIDETTELPAVHCTNNSTAGSTRLDWIYESCEDSLIFQKKKICRVVTFPLLEEVEKVRRSRVPKRCPRGVQSPSRACHFSHTACTSLVEFYIDVIVKWMVDMCDKWMTMTTMMTRMMMTIRRLTKREGVVQRPLLVRDREGSSEGPNAGVEGVGAGAHDWGFAGWGGSG